MIDVLTKEKFSTIIEVLVRDNSLSYVDAIVYWCEKHELEIEAAAKLISPTIKEKMLVECQDLNIIKKGGRLPI